MLRDKKGNPLRPSEKSTAEEDEKLRGATLNEVRMFLRKGKPDDQNWKDRALQAVSHLEWLFNRVDELAQVHEAMSKPGIWDQNPISHGMSNGLILAMAIFVEERGNPPYHRAPKKYVQDKEELLTGKAKAFMIDTVTQLEAILCIGEDGKPKGYEEFGDEEAFAEWHKDTIDRLFERQITVDEVEAALDRIANYSQKRSQNGEENAD